MDTTRTAQRIVSRMDELDLSTADVAAACGVTRVTVRNWMGGEVQPRMETLPALARILKCDIRWLCGVTDKVGRPA